jgi:hypothetical protein
MSDIEVVSVSPEVASDGVAELWCDGEQIAYTHYDLDDGDLMLRIEPRHDRTPLVIDVRSLTAALAEVGRVLAVY